MNSRIALGRTPRGAGDDAACMRRCDLVALGLVCAVLFGCALGGIRPLTMHEAILPQTAREMLANLDFIVPTSGGRPWLERPPLPQWCVAATFAVLGSCDQEWIARLPSALCAFGVVVLTVGIALRLFGAGTAVLSGLALATSFEFVSYAWLAEQDIYLCLLTTATMAAFVRAEFVRPKEAADATVIGQRPRTIWTFFALLGLCNLAKGLLFGSAIIAAVIAVFLALDRSAFRFRRYGWFWGVALAVAIGSAWPICVIWRFPDVFELWSYDLLGRLNGSYQAITQPWWHYGPALFGATAPWTPAAFVGVVAAARKIRGGNTASACRLLVAWCVAPIVLLSCASGKHHHYLLPMMPAFAMAAALGLRELGDRLERRGALWFGQRKTMGLIVGICVVAYVGIYRIVLPSSDQCFEDTQFFRKVAHEVNDGQPILVNADIGSMDVFRMLYYLRDRGTLIHNLDYLLDRNRDMQSAWIVTRAADIDKLALLGMVKTHASSRQSRRENGPGDRYTLFRITFREQLVRRSMPERISPMQAMGRR